MAETYEVTAAFVDELAAHGLRHVCISPGSRSTPLALTFARHPAITHWVHHDERSSAFFALGIAKTIAAPVAVVTTSGTATAELFPAAVEARFGRVPLLLLTADRPPALRGTGANQTIDQVNLYGSTVKLSEDVPLPDVNTVPAIRALASRAWAQAAAAPAGPVHLNFPFEEPLTPTTDPSFSSATKTVTWTAPSNAPEEEVLRTLADMIAGRRGLIVAGPRADSASLHSVLDLARATGFPVLADPLSDLRVGTHDGSQVVGHYDALTQAGFFDATPPEVVVRFGAVPTSKAVNSWLASHPDTAYATVDITGWRDPGGTAQVMVTADPDATAQELAKLATAPAPADWLPRWVEADRTAHQALEPHRTEFTELGAVVAALAHVPDGSTVWLASSMPIRQADLMLGAEQRDLRLLANRGASGIDGFVSSGLGSAVGSDRPTFLVTGDLSLFYDLTALAWAGRHRIDVTILLINNDGGGIFHLLPPVDLPEFEELFGTPHGLDFSQAASLFGIRHSMVGSIGELEQIMVHAPAGPHLVEAQFDRATGPASIRQAIADVSAALGG